MKKLLFICAAMASINAMENKMPAPLEKMKKESPSAYELWRKEVWTDEKIEQYNMVMQKVGQMLTVFQEKEGNQQLSQDTDSNNTQA